MKPDVTILGPQMIPIEKMVQETLEMSDQIGWNRAKPGSDAADYDPGFLLENAELLEQSGDHALARNIYQALVRKGLLIPQGLAGMARAYEREGDIPKAIRCYREAIAYSSELSFHQALAALLIRSGDDAGAAGVITHALGLPGLTSEQRFELHKSLGNCCTRAGEWARAENQYRKAYELNPGSDVLQVNVGGLALQKGDPEAARKHFEKALEINSRNDRAMSGLGMAHLARNEPGRAYDRFLESLRLNLGNLGAIYNLVKCAYELRKFSDASRVLREYITAHPVNANIRYSYAGILFHEGNLAEALNETARILEGNPHHAGARELAELIKTKERSNATRDDGTPAI